VSGGSRGEEGKGGKGEEKGVSIDGGFCLGLKHCQKLAYRLDG